MDETVGTLGKSKRVALLPPPKLPDFGRESLKLISVEFSLTDKDLINLPLWFADGGVDVELLLEEKRKETGFEITFILLLRLTGRLGLFSELDKTLVDTNSVDGTTVDDVFDNCRRSKEFGILADSDLPMERPNGAGGSNLGNFEMAANTSLFSSVSVDAGVELDLDESF